MPLDRDTKDAIRSAVSDEIKARSDDLKSEIREAVRDEFTKLMSGGLHPEDGFLWHIKELENWRKKQEEREGQQSSTLRAIVLPIVSHAAEIGLAALFIIVVGHYAGFLH